MTTLLRVTATSVVVIYNRNELNELLPVDGMFTVYSADSGPKVTDVVL